MFSASFVAFSLDVFRPALENPLAPVGPEDSYRQKGNAEDVTPPLENREPCQGVARRSMAVAGLANACASSQFSAFSVAGASLPALLHLPPQADAWLPGALLLGLLCLTPLAAFLNARLGPRLLLTSCLLALLALEGALLCTRQLPLLLLWTFVLGAVLAPLPPTTQALIDRLTPEKDRGAATTVWSCGTNAGALWGAMAAGVTLPRWGWTGFCLLAAPPAIIALLLLFRLPVTRPARIQPVDWRALMALPIAFGAAGFALNAAPNLGLTAPPVVWALLLSLGAVLLFQAFNRRGPAPVLDLGLLNSRSLSRALGLAIGVAAFSTGMMETLFLALFDRLDTGHLGLRGTAGGVMMVIGATLGGWVSSRRSADESVVVGLLVLCLGKLGFFFYNPGISLWEAFWPAMISSLGYGLVSTSVSFLAFAEPRCRGAAAASLLILAWQFGDAFGLPLVEALYQEDVPTLGSLGSYHHVFHLELTVTAVLTAYSYFVARRSRAYTRAG